MIAASEDKRKTKARIDKLCALLFRIDSWPHSFGELGLFSSLLSEISQTREEPIHYCDISTTTKTDDHVYSGAGENFTKINLGPYDDGTYWIQVRSFTFSLFCINLCRQIAVFAAN